jgi:histidine triad (HIT) family protein
MEDGCPFCGLLRGEETEWNGAGDIVLRTERVTAFVSPRAWRGNEGNAIVIPNEHVPDLESTPDDLVAAVYAAVRLVAKAMRAAYGCEGTSTRQHNGGAAGQEIDHLHVHVFPRHAGDRLYERTEEHYFVPAKERSALAQQLREALAGRK